MQPLVPRTLIAALTASACFLPAAGPSATAAEPAAKAGTAATAAPVAAARSAEAPAPAAEPTAPVRLEIRVQAGRSYRFRLTDDTVMRATVPGGGLRRNVTRLDGTFDLTVDRVNQDGSFNVRVRPIQQSVTVNDREVPVREADKAEATATLGRDGRLSNLSGAEKEDGERNDSMTARDFLETLFDEEAGYPSRALAVGEGWKDRVASPLDEKGAKITVNSTLVSLDLLQGRPAARLLNVVAEPVRAPADENGVTMEGMLEGGGLTSIDLNTGLPLDGRDAIRLKMNVTAPAPDGSSVNVESEANIRIRVQALPSDTR